MSASGLVPKLDWSAMLVRARAACQQSTKKNVLPVVEVACGFPALPRLLRPDPKTLLCLLLRASPGNPTTEILFTVGAFK